MSVNGQIVEFHLKSNRFEKRITVTSATSSRWQVIVQECLQAVGEIFHDPIEQP